MHPSKRESLEQLALTSLSLTSAVVLSPPAHALPIALGAPLSSRPGPTSCLDYTTVVNVHIPTMFGPIKYEVMAEQR